ncbi:hypothetical protein [Paracoccus ravus]|uniref:hypothetical protein n=1 Tax=Paracoccus ravus TaxID=2447760 RepID=UPI00106EAC9B|nr:hypothetical protein [Paracoccus ravus]
MEVHLTAVDDAERQKRRVRMGLLAPASDILIERDFWRMGMAANVDIFTTRIALEMPLTPMTLARLADGIAGASSLLLPEAQIDALVFGCTSGSAVIGPANVAARVHSVKPDLAVTNPASAAVVPYTSDVAEITAVIVSARSIPVWAR